MIGVINQKRLNLQRSISNAKVSELSDVYKAANLDETITKGGESLVNEFMSGFKEDQAIGRSKTYERVLANYFNPVELNKRLSELHIKVLFKYSLFSELHPDASEVLMFYIPEMKYRQERSYEILQKKYAGVQLFQTEQIANLEFRPFTVSQSGVSFKGGKEESKKLAIIVNPEFKQENAHLFSNIVELAATFISARQTITDAGPKKVINFMLQSETLYNETVGPGGILLTLVDLYIRFEKEFSAGEPRQRAAIGLPFADLNVGGNMQIVDFSGQRVPFPVDFEHKLRDSQELKTALVSLTLVSKNVNQVQEYMNFLSENERIIEGYIEEIKTDELKQKTNLVPVEKEKFIQHMIDENDEKNERFIKTNIETANIVDKAAVEVEGKIISTFEKIKELEFDEAAPTESAADGKTQIKVTILYFEKAFESFKQFKTIWTEKQEQILKSPRDIILAILLSERKRRMYNAKILLKASQIIAKLKSMLIIPKEDLNKVQNTIQKFHNEWNTIIEEYVTIPTENVALLTAKGERLNKGIRDLDAVLEVSSETKADVKIIRQVLEMSRKETLSLFSSDGVIEQLFKASVENTKLAIDNFNNSLKEDKGQFALWTEKIEIGLANAFIELSSSLDKKSKENMENFTYELSLLEGRFNLELEKMRKSIEKFSGLINDVISQLSNIAKDITEIKLKIIKIESLVTSNTDYIKSINNYILEFIETIRNAGLSEIWNSKTTELENLKNLKTEISNESKKIIDSFQKKSIEEILKNYQDVNTQLTNQVKTYETMQSKAKSLNEFFEKNNETVLNNFKSISSSLSNLESKNTNIKNLETSLDSLINKNNSINSFSASLDSIDGKKGKISSMLELVENLNNKKEIITSTTNLIDELNKKNLNGFNVSINELLNKSEKINEASQSINTKFSELTQKTTENKQLINQSNEYINNTLLKSLENMNNLIKNSKFNELSQTLPQMLKVIELAFNDTKIKSNSAGTDGSLKEQLNEMNENLKFILNKLLVKSSSGSGSGDGDGNDGGDKGTETYMTELKLNNEKLKQRVEILTEFIEELGHLIIDQYHQESEFISDFIKQVYEEEFVQPEIVEALMQQVQFRYLEMLEGIDKNLKKKITEKGILPKESYSKKRYLNMEIFDWWNKGNKRLKN